MNDNETVFEEVVGDPANVLNQLGYRLENYQLDVAIEEQHHVNVGKEKPVTLNHCHMYYEMRGGRRHRLVAVLGVSSFETQRAFAVPSEFE